MESIKSASYSQIFSGKSLARWNSMLLSGPSSRFQEPSLEDSASIFSFLFLFYLNPIFQKGVSGNLEFENLGGISEQDASVHLANLFAQEWAKELEKPEKSRSLWYTLWRVIGIGKLYWAIFLYVLSVAASYGPIFILDYMVQNFQGSITIRTDILFFMAAMIFVGQMVASICLAHSNMIVTHIGAQIRNTLTVAIYRKSTKISATVKVKNKENDQKSALSTGQIVNMFSQDTRQLAMFMNFINNAIIAPFEIIASLTLIYLQVGYATFIGLGLVALTFPATTLLFRIINKYRRKKMKATDNRIKLMNELLSGIRILKYYAWELPFKEKINAVRERELKFMRVIGYFQSLGVNILMFAVPVAQPVIVFWFYTQVMNEELDASTAFTTIAFFQMMQRPFIFLPVGLSAYSNSLVSCGRIMSFLQCDNLKPYVRINKNMIRMDGSQSVPIAVKVDNATLSWSEPDSNSDEPHIITLHNMTFELPKGQLLAVVGGVGSGKTSLLAALLGELACLSGSVFVDTKSVAYCQQSSWILNATLRDNILFGRPYDEELFEKTLDACSLQIDIQTLGAGLETEIGEKGINLSGGQKARIALARAIYQTHTIEGVEGVDTIYLDDPLSAVDAHVCEHLFNNCIGGILKGKTRILVTHQVHLLSQCDKILVMNNGCMQYFKSYDDYHKHYDESDVVKPATQNSKEGDKRRGSFNKIDDERRGSFIGNDVNEKRATKNKRRKTLNFQGVDDDDEDETAIDDLPIDGIEMNQLGQTFDDEAALLGARPDYEEIDDDFEVEYMNKKFSKLMKSSSDETNGSLMVKEKIGSGNISLSTYLYYVGSGGYLLFMNIILFAVLSQVLFVYGQFELATWAEDSGEAVEKGDPLSSSDQNDYIKRYALFIGFGVICLVLRSLCFLFHQTTTAKTMHMRLMDSVIDAPVAFYDTTPLGRLLNRFSSDLGAADQEVAMMFGMVLNSYVNAVGALAAIALATRGTALVLFAPLLWLYVSVQRYFTHTNTSLARIEAVLRSPIFTDFSAALAGMSSIRAYGAEKRFVKHLIMKINKNTVAQITKDLCGSWLAIRLDLLGSWISFFIALLAVASSSANFIDPALLGLALGYSFALTHQLKFATRMSSQLEAGMNSVDRIKDYTDNLDSETNTQHNPFKAYPFVLEEEDEDDNDHFQGMNSLSKIKENKPLLLDETQLRDTTGTPITPADPVNPPESWPSEGAISLNNVKVGYRDGPMVLKDCTFSVDGKQKIGIVGRTGSGKSTVMVALFRIEKLTQGSIEIDGIPTHKIPLRLLRSKLCIIPQDAVMFSASVRFNLDPFLEHSVTDIWDVLDQVSMKAAIEALPGKLDELVAEGGENFSTGQRQLICIARALLRKPKILMLDEATASIDNETDQAIQLMVRESFKNCTVLTIAHRLNTIVDSDKIVVLDRGVVIEQGSPKELLARPPTDEEAEKGMDMSDSRYGYGAFRALWERHQTAHHEE